MRPGARDNTSARSGQDYTLGRQKGALCLETVVGYMC